MIDKRIAGNLGPHPARNLFYTKEQLKLIASSRKNARLNWRRLRDLCRSVNKCAAMFEAQRFEVSDPPPSMIRNHMRTVVAAIDRATGKSGLCLPPRSEEPPTAIRDELIDAADKHADERGLPSKVNAFCVPDYGNRERLRECMRALQLLRTWATIAHEQAGKQVGAASAGPAVDVPLQTLIESLANVYERVFGVRARWSRHYDTGAIGGPFYRFLTNCLDPLGESHSAESLIGYYRRLKR